MNRIKQIIDYVCGAVDKRPEGFPLRLDSWYWGLLWGALLCLIMIFCGQSSRFVYIDF